jgi:hypothetical protein
MKGTLSENNLLMDHVHVLGQNYFPAVNFLETENDLDGFKGFVLALFDECDTIDYPRNRLRFLERVGAFQITRRYRRVFDHALSTSFSNFIWLGFGFAAIVSRTHHFPDSQCRWYFRVLHSYGLYSKGSA